MSRPSAYSAFAEVALPVPLPRTFSYGIPSELLRARPGVRVRVRFGPRALIGCITEVGKEPPELPEGARLLPIGRLLDEEPVLDAKQLELARFIADYYLASPGLVCRAMLPPDTPRTERHLYERLEGGDSQEKGGLAGEVLRTLSRPMTARAVARAVGRKTVSGTLATLVRAGLVRQRPESSTGGGRRVRTAAITDEGREALARGEKLHPTTIRILTLLSVATDPVSFSTIRNELSLTGGPFASMARRGLIALGYESVAQTPWERLRGSVPASKPSLTPAQQSAVREIVRAATQVTFQPIVLRGVTGSGKTEVYMRAAEDVLDRGRSVLILVPEIALTPRLAAVLHGRFGHRVAILHSALGSGERRDEWWRIRGGEARVVVGARAAVFAPVDDLGLVVVDEEHESSYKQEDTPRYNARDVAIVRARNEKAVVVLGSATPSLESFTHAVEERYRLLELPERIGNRPLASVDFIDMKSVVREEGPDTVLSAPLREAVDERLAASEQAMVLLNRRGYAGQLLCRQCGLALMCSECSVAMTLHRGASLAVCHYCGLGRATPERCETCRGEYLRQVGYGTERIEGLLRELFPGSRVARMDRDTMRKKGSYESLLSRFAAREIDILVGTQMLAKGHDFPAVTLVGVLAADNGLGAPDFRAAERTFQLLTQVAGRAGRGDRPGQVLIQTFAPDHYSLQFAQAQDYQGFYEMERKFRAALRYPPVVGLINIVAEGGSMAEATSRARTIASFLKREELEGVQVLGPAFAVRSKVAGRHRCQVLLKVPRRQHARVRARLRHLISDERLAKSMVVDVDPVNLS
jgi:primosomal protein N' (replication factor Y)